MARRIAFVLLASTAAATWLGCNALLGIEDASFDPLADGAANAEGSASTDGPGSNGPNDGGASDGAVVDAGSDAGPCVDTDTNARHCGRCEHDCLGGSCLGGVCQPRTVASDGAGPFSIAIDDTHVYWANVSSQQILRAPKGGGIVETIFSAPGTTLAPGLAVFGGNVYFGTDSGVFFCPSTGCAAMTPSLVFPSSPSYLEVTDGLLAFATVADNGLYECALPCAAPVIRGTASQRVISIAATPDNLFWFTVDTKLHTSTPSEPDVPIGPGGNFYGEMVISGDTLVFAGLSAGAGVLLLDGGSPRTLGAGQRNADHLSLKDGLVFFNNFGSGANDGLILACPVGGCVDGGGVLATNQVTPRGVVADDLSVFWAVEGDHDAGAIMRLAR